MQVDWREVSVLGSPALNEEKKGELHCWRL